MYLRCPICITLVQFDHHHLVNRLGYVECGHCGGKFRIAIDPELTDMELNQIEIVEQRLRVFDVDGKPVKRELPTSDWDSIPTNEHSARLADRSYTIRTGLLVLVSILLILVLMLGIFVVFVKPPREVVQVVDGVATTPTIAAAPSPFPTSPPPQETAPKGEGPNAAVQKGTVQNGAAQNAPMQNAPVQKGAAQKGAAQQLAAQPPTPKDSSPDATPDDSPKAQPSKEAPAKTTPKPSKRRPPTRSATGLPSNYASKSVAELMELAQSLQAKGDKKSAIKAYDAVISKERNNIEANFNLGKLYLSSNKASLALERFRTVARNGGGGGGKGFIFAARCEKALGHPISAKQFYQDYLRKYPSGGFAGEAQAYIESN